MSDVIPVRKERTKKQKISVLRWILLGAALLLVVLFLCFILFPRVFNIDRVTRYFRYLEKKNDSEYGAIRFDSNSSDSYALFNGSFAVGCEDGLYLYDDYGNQTALVQGSLPYPKLCVCDSLALCYSNESSVMVAMDRSGAQKLSTTVSGTVLDAELSSDGCLCYAASGTGCKTQVTVMNARLEEIYRWKSFSCYLNCCAVNRRAELLAVVGLKQEGGIFNSSLQILDTSSEDNALIAETSLGNQVIYELCFLDAGRICAIGETSTNFIASEGSIMHRFNYDGMTLLDFTWDSKGNVYLALNPHKNSKESLLVCFDSEGNELARREFPEKIQSLSVNGKYLAVLTQNTLTTCSETLEDFTRTVDGIAANRVLMRKDGTVLLVSNGQTTVWIP